MCALLAVEYAGCVHKSLQRKHYIFKYAEKKYGTKYDRYFTAATHGSLELAYAAAIQHQHSFSDEMNLTKRYFACTSDIALRRYLIGFLEGDGCIMVSAAGAITVQGAQAQNNETPAILTTLASVYGGKVKLKQKRPAQWRKTHIWLCHGIAALPVLKDWVELGTLKRNQAELVFTALQRQRNRSRFPELFLPLKIAKNLEEYQQVQIDDTKATKLAGHLFIPKKHSTRVSNVFHESSASKGPLPSAFSIASARSCIAWRYKWVIFGPLIQLPSGTQRIQIRRKRNISSSCEIMITFFREANKIVSSRTPA